jgi:hypothetical protein
MERQVLFGEGSEFDSSSCCSSFRFADRVVGPSWALAFFGFSFSAMLGRCAVAGAGAGGNVLMSLLGASARSSVRGTLLRCFCDYQIYGQSGAEGMTF